MKLIELNTTRGKRGYFAKVDDEDYDFLMQWRWHTVVYTGRVYAMRHRQKNECHPFKTILMHRAIMRVIDPKVLIDHADHDTINNQRSNIRIASASQNSANRTSRKNSSSKYLGVRRMIGRRLKNEWRSQMNHGGKQIHIGYFEKEEDAAKAYDKVAKEVYGEFANLNFK